MKKLEKFLIPLYNEIEQMFKDEKSGHDIGHLLRVVNYSREIQKHEGGNKKVVLIAALVHDIHRLMSNECGKFILPKESVGRVKEILLKSQIEITEEELAFILDIVAKHEDKSFNENESLESKIIKDADTLDALGKIGLKRTQTYCKVYNIPAYDPNFPLDAKEYIPDINPISTVHYIYRTMIPNGKNLRTETARKIALKNNKVLENFIKAQIKKSKKV